MREIVLLFLSTTDTIFLIKGKVISDTLTNTEPVAIQDILPLNWREIDDQRKY